MEDLQTTINIYLFISFIWGVLCLILFFKVWGMTNDVRQIRDYLCNGSNLNNDMNVANASEVNNTEENNSENPTSEFSIGEKVLNKYTKETVIISSFIGKDYVECVNEAGKKLGKFNIEYFVKIR